MLRLKAPKFFSSLFETFQCDINSFIKALEEPYVSLGRQAKQIVKNLSVSRIEEWEYTIDPDTGLEILKVEKDPLAIKKTRNALQDLFQ